MMRGTLERLESREWLIVENDKQKIFGVLHRPLCCDHPPIVVICHGFASSKHGSNRSYVKLAETLAKEGIASFRFDFRGCGDSEGHLSDISFEDLLSDTCTVLESVEAIDGIDCQRIGLFGASLGGALAVLAASRYKKIRAMALWAPVASGEIWLRDFLVQNPQFLRSQPIEALASYRGIPIHPIFREQFGKMAAWKNLQELQCVATLIMQGEQDTTITMAHHEAYKNICAFRNNVRFVKYQDGEHTLGLSPYFPDVLDESLNWFRNHL